MATTISMKTALPSVTFVTPTLNSESTIRECIESVDKLDYPKKLIRMFIVDDGSKDKTLSIARKYPFCKIFNVKTSGPEEATAIGYNKAVSDYVVNFPSDNVITHPNWLKKMLLPLEEDSDIVASETFRYSYIKSDKPLNRYFALFGVNDPIALYLNKRDRATYFENDWHLSSDVTIRPKYFKTSFTENNLPTVGANGFVVRTKIVQKVSKQTKKFSHIDSCVDLLRLGYSTYAFVKTDIWHKSGEQFGNFFYKRRKYALNLYFKKKTTRRYHLYNPQTDTLKLIMFVLFAMTFIEPVIRSIRGYLKIRDAAWFLHPIICFVITINYLYTLVLFQIYKWKNTIKEKTV